MIKVLLFWIFCSIFPGFSRENLLNNLAESLSNPQLLNFELAKASLREISELPRDFTIQDVLFAHYLSNLYLVVRNFPDSESRMKDIAELLYIGITEKNAYIPNPNSIPDADLIFKLLSIKNLTLTNAALSNYINKDIERNKNLFLKYPAKIEVFRTLFQLPCDSVRVGKTLLNASNVFAAQFMNKVEHEPQFLSLKLSLLNVLYNMSMGGVFSFSSREVFANSKFEQVLNNMILLHLENQSFSTIDGVSVNSVSLSTLTDAISEIVGNIFTAMVSFPKNYVNDIEQGSNRNLLHIISHVGLSSILEDIVTIVRIILKEELVCASVFEFKAKLILALQQRDYRGHSPLSYSAVRSVDPRCQKLFYLLYEELYQSSVTASIVDENPALSPLMLTDFSKYKPSAAASQPLLESHRNESIEYWKMDIENETGGWNKEILYTGLPESHVEKLYSSDFCDIDQYFLDEPPSPAEFYNLFVNLERPAIFRGLAWGTKIMNTFQKAEFIDKFGHFITPVSTIPYAHTFGQNMVNMRGKAGNAISTKFTSFAQLATNESVSVLSNSSNGETEYLYSFTTAFPKWTKAIQNALDVWPFVSNSKVLPDGSVGYNSNVELQFYLGPAGSGAPMHFHGHAVNTLAYGMKHWYLVPPNSSFYSTEPSINYINNKTRHTSNVLECIQHSGDVLYVPTLWSHATLNRKQSIGVAHEFSIESFCMD